MAFWKRKKTAQVQPADAGQVRKSKRMRIFSSAEYFRRVSRRISRTTDSGFVSRVISTPPLTMVQYLSSLS